MRAALVIPKGLCLVRVCLGCGVDLRRGNRCHFDAHSGRESVRDGNRICKVRKNIGISILEHIGVLICTSSTVIGLFSELRTEYHCGPR
jgi:hypothetical protein